MYIYAAHKAHSLRIRVLAKLNSVFLFSMQCLAPNLRPLKSHFCPLTGILKRPVFGFVGQISQLSGLLMFFAYITLGEPL